MRAKSEIVTPFLLVMPLMQPSILLPFFYTEATVHSHRSCFPPGEWLYSAGKGRTEESVKTNCFSVLLVTESPLLLNNRLIFFVVCLFVFIGCGFFGFLGILYALLGFFVCLFCLFTYLKKELFLVVFVMSQQSKFERRFWFKLHLCMPWKCPCISVCVFVLHLWYTFGFEHTQKLSIKPRWSSALPASLPLTFQISTLLPISWIYLKCLSPSRVALI